jgi:hypothetical protein
MSNPITTRSTVRVGWVPAGSNNTASSRLRAYKVHEHLSTSSTRYRSRVLRRLTPSPEVDVLVLQRVYGGEELNDLIRHYRSKGVRVVLDLCDVYPDARATASAVDLVTTNSVTRVKQFVQAGFACPFRVVEEPIDYDLDGRPLAHPDLQPLRPVWFGTYTNVGLVRTLSSFLRATAVTSQAVRTEIPADWEFVEWEYRGFVDLIRRFNLCLLPQNDPGKSANKMVTALMCGLPVVASDIPSYRDIADAAGTSGFLCRSPEDWVRSVEKLKDRGERIRYLEKTQPLVQEKYGIQKIAGEWTDLFEEMVSRPARERNGYESNHCHRDASFGNEPPGTHTEETRRLHGGRAQQP